MEMGFDEELAIDALRAKGNVQEEAVSIKPCKQHYNYENKSLKCDPA